MCIGETMSQTSQTTQVQIESELSRPIHQHMLPMLRRWYTGMDLYDQSIHPGLMWVPMYHDSIHFHHQNCNTAAELSRQALSRRQQDREHAQPWVLPTVAIWRVPDHCVHSIGAWNGWSGNKQIKSHVHERWTWKSAGRFPCVVHELPSLPQCELHYWGSGEGGVWGEEPGLPVSQLQGSTFQCTVSEC